MARVRYSIGLGGSYTGLEKTLTACIGGIKIEQEKIMFVEYTDTPFKEKVGWQPDRICNIDTGFWHWGTQVNEWTPPKELVLYRDIIILHPDREALALNLAKQGLTIVVPDKNQVRAYLSFERWSVSLG